MAQENTVWSWLWRDAQTSAPALPAAPLDDDLDFLQAPEEGPEQTQPLAPRASDAQRWGEARQWATAEPVLPPDWSMHARDGRWPGIDGPAAWLACGWWCRAADVAAVRGTAHGPVSQLLRRAVRAAAPEVALAAAAAVAHLRVDEVQEDVALRLMELDSLDHEQQSALLDVLDTLGDGRCVRAMEAVLAAVGPRMADHHAWRARHIVQRIRRGGRR